MRPPRQVQQRLFAAASIPGQELIGCIGATPNCRQRARIFAPGALARVTNSRLASETVLASQGMCRLPFFQREPAPCTPASWQRRDQFGATNSLWRPACGDCGIGPASCSSQKGACSASEHFAGLFRLCRKFAHTELVRQQRRELG